MTRLGSAGGQIVVVLDGVADSLRNVFDRRGRKGDPGEFIVAEEIRERRVLGHGNWDAIGDRFTDHARVIEREESWIIRRDQEVATIQDLGPRGRIDRPVCDGDAIVDDGHFGELFELALHDPKAVMNAHLNRKAVAEEPSSQLGNDPESLSDLLRPDEANDDRSFASPRPWSRSSSKRVRNGVDRLANEA